MDSDSPLRFLDIDVSQYIYETYYQTEKARNLKKIMNGQFIRSIKKYKLNYHIDNIYDYEIMFCKRGSLYRRVYFLAFLNGFQYRNLKYKTNKYSLSYFRAIKYKNEVIHMKKLVNHIL